jgi:hypothetical protein
MFPKYILKFFLSIFWIRNFNFNFGPKIVQQLKKLAIYIYYFILFYIRRAILTQTNPKKV